MLIPTGRALHAGLLGWQLLVWPSQFGGQAGVVAAWSMAQSALVALDCDSYMKPRRWGGLRLFSDTMSGRTDRQTDLPLSPSPFLPPPLSLSHTHTHTPYTIFNCCVCTGTHNRGSGAEGGGSTHAGGGGGGGGGVSTHTHTHTHVGGGEAGGRNWAVTKWKDKNSCNPQTRELVVGRRHPNTDAETLVTYGNSHT